MRTIIFACGLAAATLGQAAAAAQPERASASAAERAPDPVASFKAFIATASEPRQWERVYEFKKQGKWVKHYYTLDATKFDVQKTDSLISPVKGVVSISLKVVASEFANTEQEAKQSNSLSKANITYLVSAEYLFTDGAWRVDHFSYRANIEGLPSDRTTINAPREKLLRDRGADTNIASILAKWVL